MMSTPMKNDAPRNGANRGARVRAVADGLADHAAGAALIPNDGEWPSIDRPE